MNGRKLHDKLIIKFEWIIRWPFDVVSFFISCFFFNLGNEIDMRIHFSMPKINEWRLIFGFQVHLFLIQQWKLTTIITLRKRKCNSLEILHIFCETAYFLGLLFCQFQNSSSTFWWNMWNDNLVCFS